jgi:recombination protein RecA
LTAKKKRKVSKKSNAAIVQDTLHACFKSDVTYLMADVADASDNAVPTLITAFDYGLLGIGGVPMGHFFELAGDDKSGKTTMLLHMMAALQARGVVPLVMDAKGAVSSDVARAKRIGVDPSMCVIVPVVSSEEVTQKVRESLGKIYKEGAKIALFWDDLGLTPTEYELSPGKDQKTKKDKMKPGDKAKAIYTFCRTLAGDCYKLGAPVIVANNLTSVINTGWAPTGSPVETSSSGGGLRYTSRIRVVLKPGAQIKDKSGNVVGKLVRAQTIANAFFSPFRRVELALNFRNGFDSNLSTIHTALKSDYVKKKKGKYQIKGSSELYAVDDIPPRDLYALECRMWPWITGTYSDPADIKEVLDEDELAEEEFAEGFI